MIESTDKPISAYSKQVELTDADVRVIARQLMLHTEMIDSITDHDTDETIRLSRLLSEFYPEYAAVVAKYATH